MSAAHLNTEGNTYEYQAENEPQGYVTYGGALPDHIDKTKCRTRLSQTSAWSSAIAMLLFGPLLVLAQGFG